MKRRRRRGKGGGRGRRGGRSSRTRSPPRQRGPPRGGPATSCRTANRSTTRRAETRGATRPSCRATKGTARCTKRETRKRGSSPLPRGLPTCPPPGSPPRVRTRRPLRTSAAALPRPARRFPTCCRIPSPSRGLQMRTARSLPFSLEEEALLCASVLWIKEESVWPNDPPEVFSPQELWTWRLFADRKAKLQQKRSFFAFSCGISSEG